MGGRYDGQIDTVRLGDRTSETGTWEGLRGGICERQTGMVERQAGGSRGIRDSEDTDGRNRMVKRQTGRDGEETRDV